MKFVEEMGKGWLRVKLPTELTIIISCISILKQSFKSNIVLKSCPHPTQEYALYIPHAVSHISHALMISRKCNAQGTVKCGGRDKR